MQREGQLKNLLVSIMSQKHLDSPKNLCCNSDKECGGAGGRSAASPWPGCLPWWTWWTVE